MGIQAMTAKFQATTIARTGTQDGALEITLSDAAGRITTVALPPSLARGLAQLMGEFAGTVVEPPASLVKRPKSFAVGTGRHEKAVLLRFNDDVPYAVSPDTAAELAGALLEASEEADQLPNSKLQ